jgi:Trypsin-like serine proteases, typically periplasmic, contain C-terminal PDZ domain
MDELDSYSRTVSAVAAELTGKVAAVRTGRGSGSAVVVDAGGVLVTNAHVVGEALRGHAEFVDGTQVEVAVVGSDRCPTSPSCAPPGPGTCRRRYGSGTPTGSSSASSWSPWATRSGSPVR